MVVFRRITAAFYPTYEELKSTAPKMAIRAVTSFYPTYEELKYVLQVANDYVFRFLSYL